uniref:ESPR-type extended signal peptide-containing protein n=1 Tax=Dialister sp. TaxID=1955814 RepID=UPI004024CC3D
MNHIYKVIWNHAKHCYTVVSEIAKNHSTSSVTKKKVSIAAILAAGMLSGFSPMVSGAVDTIVYDQNGTSLKSTNSGSVGKNAIALGQGASAVDNSIAIGNGASVVGGTHGKDGVALGTNAHAGYKGTSLGNGASSGREGTIVIGDTTDVRSLYSTVVGTNSKITSDNTKYKRFGKEVNVQGAVSTSYGAHNTITNEKKVFSGVANSIIGSVNTVTNSNGVTIQGTGNTVSNAYKDMDIGLFDLWDFSDGDYSSLAKKNSGAIAIIGGGNTISNQTSSTVIGFRNTLEGGENSTGVLMAGSQNTLTNVSNSLVMGDNNTLVNRKNVISLGNQNTVTADEAVAIGNGTKVEAVGGVAIGVGSVADRAAGIKGAFAPDTIPTGEESTWTSTAGAFSVGEEGKTTRQITNVAAGSKATDAVNVAQLFATNQQVAQNAQSINKLGNRINKVGAGAAALAALHPLDFDPDDKWDFAAGYGNYNGENAAAIGAYYRPNEDTMFSVGGSFGNGENMVNAGVSLKLGQGNHVSTSKVAMAKEIKDLRKELEGLKSALLDANAGKKLDTSKLQLFPDVPKNHWAYEYVSTLKGNGVLTGYPDGEFKGDRPMTRYEFATMLYKAMLEGATLSDRILKEFAPELERFTVDTVHQDKDGKPTVERVRTVKAEK